MLTVTAAIIRKDGKYLISRRKKHDSMGGYWEFPGGGVDAGETPDQCIVREIEEELGVDARADELFDTVVCGDAKAVILFYCCSINSEPKPLDCDELRWVHAHELKEYKFLPADAAVIDRLCGKQTH